MTDSNAMTSTSTNAISVKLPPFWGKSPVFWFTRAESIFRRAGITVQETMYDHVLAVLPEESISDVYDVIEKIATSRSTTPYTTLKDALISRNTLSEKERLEQILSKESLGDRKPSDFYRHLKHLAGNSSVVNDELIKSLWTRRLPVEIQCALTTSSKTDIQDLTELADMLAQIRPQQNSLFAVSTPAASEDRLSRLEMQIAEMSKNLAALAKGSGSRSRSKSRNRRPNSPHPNSSVCYFHNKFGADARRCRAPCTWKEN